MRSTQVPYGLRARGATALAPAADGVWIAEEPDALSTPDLALTFASRTLETWRWLTPARGALSVSAMAVRGQHACLATNAGTLVVDLEAKGQSEPRLLDVAPIGRPVAAWSTADGCWIGGTTGIARVSWPADSASTATLVNGSRGAFAFASSGDTVWAATLSGVERYVGGRLSARDALADTLTVPMPNVLRGPIRGIALAGDGLALLTDRELWLTSGASRMDVALRVDAPLGRIGRIRRVAADARTLWLGGTLGAAAFSLGDHRWRSVALADPSASVRLDAGSQTDVRDIVLGDGVAWLATGAGIVRVARADDGMPR
jgi:hypothetical protein